MGGLRVAVFPGDAGNTKLTTRRISPGRGRRLASLAILRTGSGFDVHAFADGDHVMLGGVRIPHERASPAIGCGCGAACTGDAI